MSFPLTETNSIIIQDIKKRYYDIEDYISLYFAVSKLNFILKDKTSGNSESVLGASMQKA